jgi:hypothetical protein
MFGLRYCSIYLFIYLFICSIYQIKILLAVLIVNEKFKNHNQCCQSFKNLICVVYNLKRRKLFEILYLEV